MTRVLCAVILCAAAVWTVSAEDAKPDPLQPSWPAWRGPNRNGVTEDAAWNPKSLEKPVTLWKVKVGQGYSSVCVAGGYLYTVGLTAGFPSMNETLYCLDAATGVQKWSFAYPSLNVDHPGSRATPVFENGRLYLMSLTGQAYCVDAATGARIWDTDIAGRTGAERPQWGFASSAWIEGGLAVFSICKSGVALNKENGSIVWKSGTAVSSYATPVGFTYKDKRLLAVLSAKQLTVVEAASGKEVASAPWGNSTRVNGADPLVIGDRIFVGSDYGSGCALFTLEDGALTKLWSNTQAAPHFPSPVYSEGRIYCGTGFAGSGSGGILCLNEASGSIMGYLPAGFCSFILAGARIVMTTETGDVMVLEWAAGGFSQIAKATRVVPRLCWTAPVLVRGRLYLRSDKGDLICLDVS